MPWNPARRHQDGVEANIADTAVGIAGQPCFGGGGDAQALAVGDRPGRIVESFARLDLDKDQQGSAAGDDIDFPDRALPTPSENAEAFSDEKRCRAAFGGNAGSERDLALGTRSLDRTCGFNRLYAASRFGGFGSRGGCCRSA